MHHARRRALRRHGAGPRTKRTRLARGRGLVRWSGRRGWGAADRRFSGRPRAARDGAAGQLHGPALGDSLLPYAAAARPRRLERLERGDRGFRQAAWRARGLQLATARVRRERRPLPASSGQRAGLRRRARRRRARRARQRDALPPDDRDGEERHRPARHEGSGPAGELRRRGDAGLHGARDRRPARGRVSLAEHYGVRATGGRRADRRAARGAGEGRRRHPHPLPVRGDPQRRAQDRRRCLLLGAHERGGRSRRRPDRGQGHHRRPAPEGAPVPVAEERGIGHARRRGRARTSTTCLP